MSTQLRDLTPAPKVAEAIVEDDATVVVEAGSRVPGPRMFYVVVDMAVSDPVERDDWSQPIPDYMSRTEAEYDALIRGLEAARERGYSKVVVTTNSGPIVGHLREGKEYDDELRPLYEEATRLRDTFEEFRLMYYFD